MIEGDEVVHELVVAAPRERVFEMLVDPALLVRWIGLSADLDPRPGGVFRFEVAPGQHCEGRYVSVERPRRVVVTWGWTDPAMGLPPGTSRVEIDLAEDEGGTRLRLVHRDLPGDLRPIHDEGWGRFLARLEAVAEGREPGEHPAGDPRARRRGRGGRAVIRARVDTEIARPAADVFAVLSDAERNPLWQRGMRSCRWTTPPPLTAGSEYEQEAAFLGRRVRTRFVVTSLDPGRRLTLASLPGSSFPLAVTREVEPLGPGRCRASEAVEGDPSGVYRLAAPLLRALVLRSMRSDHRRLRRLLEEGRTA